MARYAVLLALLSFPALAEEPQLPPPADQRAACLKTCAGEPKEATPEKLMACLKGCGDGGVSTQQPPPARE